MTVYLLCYAACWMLSVSGHHRMAGMGMIAAAGWLWYRDWKISGTPLHLRGLFAFSFVGGEGLALLKLSRISGVWTTETWLSFLLTYVVFHLVFGAVSENTLKKDRKKAPIQKAASLEESLAPETGVQHAWFGMFLAITGLSAVVLLAFLFEAARLRYIPFFVRGVPHAYAYFHVKGVHYFTVSAVLLPAMAVIWFLRIPERNLRRDIPVASAALLGLLIPILCASRSQMLFSILLTVLVYARMTGTKVRRGAVLGACLLAAVLFGVLSLVRGHGASYLNAVFEMKNAHMPVFFSQPYMYIINNYENFNFLTQHLQHHTLGAKGLFPLWTFTGLKNHYWFLTCWGNLYVKSELTTTTIIYDAWYDYGIPGVMAFAAALAAVSAKVEGAVRNGRNPFRFLFWGQMALYLLLSFFTAWFSLPVTWFYFGVTGIAAAMTAVLDEGAGKQFIQRFRRKKH